MNRTIQRWAAVIAIGIGLAACSTPPPQDAALTKVPVIGEPAADAPAASAPAAVPYTFMLGDELDVKIADAPQYDQTVKVTPDGKVNLNVIGTVFVAGRSPENVQNEIRLRYSALAGSDKGREYLIHANDELDVKFPYYPQFNDQIRVRPDGKIQLQLAGTLQAEGMTPEELEHELRLRYSRYLKEPELSVIVRTATSQVVRTAAGSGRGGLAGLEPVVIVRSFQTPQVFVTGEVGRPGMIPFTTGLTLLQALAEAGGHLPSGDVTKIVIMRKSAAQTADLIRPGLTKTFRSAPTLDIDLQPYDVVILPPTKAQNVAENLDRYVYKLFAPLKNSSFGYVYSKSTTVY